MVEVKSGVGGRCVDGAVDDFKVVFRGFNIKDNVSIILNFRGGLNRKF
jgi:hypothetical protein